MRVVRRVFRRDSEQAVKSHCYDDVISWREVTILPHDMCCIDQVLTDCQPRGTSDPAP